MALNPVEIFLDSFRAVCPQITEDELDFVRTRVTVSEFEKRAFYLKEGQIQQSLCFIVSGLIRSYYLDEKGNEINVGFCMENEYSTDYGSFITQRPSKYYFQFLEPSLVVNLPYAVMQEGYERFKNLERYGRLITEEILKMHQARLEGFLFDKAEERYLNFVKHRAKLFNRISLTYLSSYLGIERQSLSRIRNAIVKK
ncbi:Crp/Fnr family transcriptional regulator [Pedobacter sp. MW01-1-1]|uniref:Crp/Fnr family transcriptional regulator n=1 Tax=Pedobacter sp. MW01-1-1 TaxID=3383027 RepID=UPI003FEF616E